MNSRCPYCGEATHTAEYACPRIRAVYYRSDGTVARIEFHAVKTIARIARTSFTRISGEDAVTLRWVPTALRCDTVQ
jgi:hypothetical protein